MKKKTRVIVSSALSIAVCASLITSSTLALFTSESKTNIAITSGKVRVTASAKLTKVYSAEWSEDTYVDKEVEHTGEYENGTEYSFTNGGTAKYEDTTLTLGNISPGDGVEFEVSATNESTIAIKYQTVVTFVSGGSVDEEATSSEDALYKAMKINVGEDEDISSGRTTAVSEWTEVPEIGGDIDPIKVDIRLPIEAENVQNMTCNIVIGVYAVQANGHDETNKDVYLVNKASDLGNVIENMEDGGIVAFADDLSVSQDTPIDVPAGKDITFDVNGNNMQVEQNANSPTSTQGCIEVAAGSSLTITDSSSADGTGDGTFELNITKEGGGNMGYEEGIGAFPIYVKGTADEKAELNFENVQMNVNDESDAPNVVGRLSHGEVNLGENTNIELNGGAYTGLFYVGDQSEVNLNSGAVVSARGSQVTPFVVGCASDHDGDGQSTLNVNGGEIDVEGGNSAMGVQVGAGGVVNMNSGTIKVHGDLTLDGEISESTAACSAIGIDNRFGGWNTADSTVNIAGGEIVLQPKKGTAYGIAVWPGNANIILGGNCKISCKVSEPAYAYALCCSDSYTQKEYGSAIPHDMIPSITLQEDVQIEYDNERNMLFSGLTNRGDEVRLPWSASAANIHDKTEDQRFEAILHPDEP